MKNTFGNAVSLTIFGESHGAAIGAVLDGLAAGLPVESDYIAARMERRRARGDGLSTARTEADAVVIVHHLGTIVDVLVLIIVFLVKQTLLDAVKKRHTICSFHSGSLVLPGVLCIKNANNSFIYYRIFCLRCQ